MSEVELVVAPTTSQLAADVVARVVGTLTDVLRHRSRAALALTAGSIMESVWAQLARSADAHSVEWSRVDVFWGDERFVPPESHDRNDAPAERVLFSRGPFSAATRYSMPAAGAQGGDDLDAAAADYARTLRGALRDDDEGEVPNFDIVLLGVGPDGHCCSLFPNHPSASDTSSPVIAVRNSPKPPPRRISLSFDGLNAANEIWVVASGTGKADAVARALAPGADRVSVPSAGARGRHRTLWLIDEEAATETSR
jgi:6-phosphogluconolactonase